MFNYILLKTLYIFSKYIDTQAKIRSIAHQIFNWVWRTIANKYEIDII